MVTETSEEMMEETNKHSRDAGNEKESYKNRPGQTNKDIRTNKTYRKTERETKKDGGTEILLQTDGLMDMQTDRRRERHKEFYKE